MKNKNKLHSIKITDKTWRKLMRWKLDLNCKSIDELLNRILKITSAQELDE